MLWPFKRKKEMHYIVTFYLSNGKEEKVNYSEEKLLQLFNALKSSWHTTGIVGPEWGINFSHVVNYKVTKEAV